MWGTSKQEGDECFREGLCGFKGIVDVYRLCSYQSNNIKLPRPNNMYISLRIFSPLKLLAPEVFDVDGLAALALGVVVVGPVPLVEVVVPLLVEPPVFVSVDPVGRGAEPVEVITTPDPEAPL
jgi:hypothetical protein